MNTSSNYQFNLPQATDTVDISKLSDNWDKLDSQLKSVQNTAENTESFTGQRSNLQTDSTDTLVSAINEVNSHVDTNENNLNSEIERAKKEESTLSSSIETETKRVESALTTSLNIEVERAKKAEETNATAISTEKSRAEGAESTLTNNLNSEITRAKAAEKANADDISSLKTQSSSHGTNVTNLTKRVAANESAISTLNGTGDGSVSKQVSDAVAKIVADAPDDFDTLKEISDWISTHAEDASAMNTQIETNKSDISKLSDKLDKINVSGYDDTEIKESISEINEKISNIDNTSDADKPVSTATQTALDKKQDTIDDLDTIRSNASEAKSASETNVDAITEINKALGSADYSALASTITEGLKILQTFKDTTENALAGLENPDLLGKGGYIGRRIEGGGMIFFDYSLGFKGDVSVAPITSNLHTYHVDALTGMVVCDDRSDTSKVDRFYAVSDYDIGEYKHGDSLMWSNGKTGKLYTTIGTATGFGTGKANTEKCIAAAQTDGVLGWSSAAYDVIWHYVYEGDWIRVTDDGQYAWFVPSKDELTVLGNMQHYTLSKRYSYDGKTQLRQLPENLHAYYWSSSEASATTAYKLNSNNVYVGPGDKNDMGGHHIRLIRRF